MGLDTDMRFPMCLTMSFPQWSLVLRKRNVSDGQLDSAMPKASD